MNLVIILTCIHVFSKIAQIHLISGHDLIKPKILINSHLSLIIFYYWEKLIVCALDPLDLESLDINRF